MRILHASLLFLVVGIPFEARNSRQAVGDEEKTTADTSPFRPFRERRWYGNGKPESAFTLRVTATPFFQIPGDEHAVAVLTSGRRELFIVSHIVSDEKEKTLLRVVDPEQGKLTQEPIALLERATATCATYSPRTDRFLLGGSKTLVSEPGPFSGEQSVYVYLGVSHNIQSIAIHKSGQQFATGDSAGHIEIRSKKSPTIQIDTGKLFVEEVAWIPGTTHVAALGIADVPAFERVEKQIAQLERWDDEETVEKRRRLDGAYLLALYGRKTQLQIWDGNNGKLVSEFRDDWDKYEGFASLTCFEISDNGKVVYTADASGTVRYLQLADFAENCAVFTGKPGYITDLALSDDHRLLALSRRTYSHPRCRDRPHQVDGFCRQRTSRFACIQQGFIQTNRLWKAKARRGQYVGGHFCMVD